MQTWARRGLQAALITGGLLMLGTGIASANENVNPDRPASPLDPKVKIPVRVHDNAIGTPSGQKNLPKLNRDVVLSTDAVTSGSPIGKAGPAVSKAQSAAGGVQSAAGRVSPVGRVTPKAAEVFRGNKVTPHAIVPVEFAGNAVAAGGDAHVTGASQEQQVNYSPVWTDGTQGVVAGNAANLDWALPIRISGNALAVLSKATTYYASENSTTTGGDIVTGSREAVLSGNVLSGQFATPVGVTGNAVSGLGVAKAFTDMHDEAHAPGNIKTNGDQAVLSGTGAGVPVALPVNVHGNPISLGGKSYVTKENGVEATAGRPLDAQRGSAAGFITTSGKESVLSGTVAEPTVATAATASCDAVTLASTAECGGVSELASKAGGATATNGDKSALGGTSLTPSVASPVQAFANSVAGGGLSDVHHSNYDAAGAGGDTVTGAKEGVLAGTVADPAISGPVEAFGNAAAVQGTSNTDSLDNVANKAGGNASSNADGGIASGTVASPAVALPGEAFGQAAAVGGKATALVGEHKVSTAGGDSVVHADGSVLGGSAVRPTVAGPAQILGNGATVLGSGTSDVYNDITTKGGGHTGTTGNDSALGGNAVTPTVGLPGEVFANNANVGGLTSGRVTENKVTTAGGSTNTHDDAGVLASNAAVADVVGPVQVFGNALTAGGIANSSVTKKTVAKGGGLVVAKGTGGDGSGNVAAVPLAVPAQVFGMAGGVMGKANAWAEGDTSSTAGGPVITDGKLGTLSGNVASVPGAWAAQVFGTGAGIASNANAAGDNHTGSTAGGDVLTSGSDGSLAGNVASAQLAPIAQVFGNAVAGTGLVNAVGAGHTTAVSGGDITTNGDRGSISGNLADVPVAALAQVFGNAAAAGGSALGVAPNKSNAVVGGTDTTSGKGGNASGNLATVPVAAVAQASGDAASVIGNATGVADNHTAVLTGGDGKTSGEFGSISGNLFTVPVAAAPQVFGNAASLGGHAIGLADNNTAVLSGGDYVTDGELKTLSGVEEVAPLGAVVQVFDIPIPVVAHAIAHGTDNTLVEAEETAPIIDLPIDGGNGLAANKLPKLPIRGALPHKELRSKLPAAAPNVQDVDIAGLPHGTALPGANLTPQISGTVLDGIRLPSLEDVTSGKVLSAEVTDVLPVLNATKLPPVGRSRSDLPVRTPGVQDVDIAGLPNGTAIPDVNVVPQIGGTDLNGVTLPNVQDVTSGSALSALDATQTLPILNAVRLLPVRQYPGGRS